MKIHSLQENPFYTFCSASETHWKVRVIYCGLYTCLILQQHCWLWTLYVSSNISANQSTQQQRSWMNKMNPPLSCLASWLSLCHVSPAEKCILKINLFETDSLIEVKVLSRISQSSMHAKRPKKEQNKLKRRRIFHLWHCFLFCP